MNTHTTIKALIPTVGRSTLYTREVTLSTERLEELLTALAPAAHNQEATQATATQVRRFMTSIINEPLPQGRAWKAYAKALEGIVTAYAEGTAESLGDMARAAGKFQAIKTQAAAVMAGMDLEGLCIQWLAALVVLKERYMLDAIPSKADTEHTAWVRRGPKEAPQGRALKDWFRWLSYHYRELSVAHLEAFYDSRVKASRPGWPTGSQLMRLWDAASPEPKAIHQRVNCHAQAQKRGPAASARVGGGRAA